MHTGAMQVRLLIRESRSLKDKRQVVRSILDRLRGGFNAAAAEIEAQDNRQVAVLGFATVAAEAAQVRATLDGILKALRAHPAAEFLGHEMDA